MPDPTTSAEGHEAGALLRAARERRGIDIATLAMQLKVSPARLQALEAGRFGELPDATFARALALAICRALGIDPQPVLERLPRSHVGDLEKVSTGLNTPFRDRPGSVVPAEWTPWRKPALWTAVALLIGAVVFLLLPPNGFAPVVDLALPSLGAASTAPAASVSLPAAVEPATAAPPAAGASAGAAAPTPAPAPSAPTDVPAAATEAVAPPPPAVSPLAVEVRLSVLRSSWIQAVDGEGRVLLSRQLGAGETVDLPAVPPVKLRIGNAGATQLVYRGQAVDLEPFTRDNVANIELH